MGEDRNRDGLLQKAFGLHRGGRLQEAAEIYREILALDAADFDALQFLGAVQGQLGNHTDALPLFEKVTLLRPECAHSINNLGVSQGKLNLSASALTSHERAIQIRADYAEAFFNRGVVLEKLERWEGALASYECAIQIKPDYVEALCNTGIVLIELNRLEEALKNFDYVKLIKSDDPVVFYYRGLLFDKLERWEGALTSLAQAICIKPDYADAHSARSVALYSLKRWEEAFVSFEYTFQLDPNFLDAHWNYSHMLLLLGRFIDGWGQYEWRLHKDDMHGMYYRGLEPRWRGQEIITGKKLFIHCEQGLGDSIQFVRYIPKLAGLGAEIFFEVPKPLLRLFESMKLPVTLISEGDPLPTFDVHCPLMSLPYILKTTVETIPASIPYLHAEKAIAASWKQRLGVTNKLRVGLVWSGSATNKIDARRSIPLASLLPLLELPIEWHSLQKEYRDSDKAVLDRENSIHRHEEDFVSTAALIDCLDLVISVDTSLAHLAGAMGAPVWVLLPFVPDFRWMLDRDDSPWYPSARLFRQNQRREWGSVVSAVHAALSEFIRLRGGNASKNLE